MVDFDPFDPEPPRPTVTPRPIDASRIYVVDRPQAVQSEIRVGHLGVPRSCEDYFSVSVMNALFVNINYLQVLRGVLLRDAALPSLLPDAGVLLLMAAVIVGLSVRRFSKTMD